MSQAFSQFAGLFAAAIWAYLIGPKLFNRAPDAMTILLFMAGWNLLDLIRAVKRHIAEDE